MLQEIMVEASNPPPTKGEKIYVEMGEESTPPVSQILGVARSL